MSIASDDDTDSTESDAEYDSEHHPDVNLRMEDDVDALDSIDVHDDVNMEWVGDDEEEEEEEEEDKDEEDEEEEEDEDEDEDDGKEPWMISQGEMVNTSAGNADTMVDDQQIVRAEQREEMDEHTPQPQPPAPARWTQTPEPHPCSQTPETHPLCGLEDSGLGTPQ